MERRIESGTPLPITSLEMLAWATLHRVDLQEWEVRAIKALDMQWLESVRNEGQNG